MFIFSVTVYYSQALAQSPSLPPLESLPPEQNPFRPQVVRNMGEIDTLSRDGSRFTVYISAPVTTGDVALAVYPHLFNTGFTFGKSFNFSMRAAYSGSPVDQFQFATVRVPVLLYEGVGVDETSFEGAVLPEICAYMEDTEQKVCGSELYQPGQLGPTRIQLDFSPR